MIPSYQLQPRQAGSRSKAKTLRFAEPVGRVIITAAFEDESSDHEASSLSSDDSSLCDTAARVSDNMSESLPQSISTTQGLDIDLTITGVLHTAASKPAVAASATAASASVLLYRRLLFNYVLMPPAIPFLALYWLVSFVIAVAATLCIVPSVMLAKRLYWACPFIPYIWSQSARQRLGWLGSWWLRLMFEGAHCMTVLTRLLTLPMRPQLPSFYIIGFPVSTPALYLQQPCVPQPYACCTIYIRTNYITGATLPYFTFFEQMFVHMQ